MSKHAAGLPENFSLNVGNQASVSLGDYLDETAAPVPTSKHSNSTQKEQPRTKEESNVTTEPKSTRPPVTVGQTKRVKRRQLNMNPATINKLDSIVRRVREYGPQGDASVSEIMDAIISIHYESLNELRLGSVRPRGRWGTPTAEAFKDALAQSFAKALSDYQSQKS